MTASLKYVSSPVAVTLQSYYSAASTGFATWAGRGDGTQPSGTPASQSIPLQASPFNVVDVNATSWLASWIAAHTGDALLSQIAINATIAPPPSAQPGTVIPPGPTPITITVSPNAPSIAKGLTQQFNAVGRFADGSTRNINNLVTWASSSAHVTIAAGGLATAATIGTAAISATLNGVVGTSATMAVTAATLVSIVATPPTASIAPTDTQQYTATGHYTDSTTQDLTASATWASDAPSFATIAAGGLATGVADGVANITAQSGLVTSPSVALTVTG